ISNTEIHILDEHLSLVPPGSPGELMIGGIAVGNGYVGRADTTAEKFIPDPFGDGRRMYRSGDVARRLNDGRIEFLGRGDQQIKLRGYRIELGEIESAIMEHEEVRESAVIAGQEVAQEGALVAYIVAQGGRSGGELRVEELVREWREMYRVNS